MWLPSDEDVLQEIDRPDVAWSSGLRWCTLRYACHLPTLASPNRLPLQAIEALDAIVIDAPHLALEQDVQSSIDLARAAAHTRGAAARAGALHRLARVAGSGPCAAARLTRGRRAAPTPCRLLGDCPLLPIAQQALQIFVVICFSAVLPNVKSPMIRFRGRSSSSSDRSTSSRCSCGPSRSGAPTKPPLSPPADGSPAWPTLRPPRTKSTTCSSQGI
jgi:hypothetical protein